MWWQDLQIEAVVAVLVMHEGAVVLLTEGAAVALLTLIPGVMVGPMAVVLLIVGNINFFP